MQQALDQMNVQVHRAVSDLTGETGMRIVWAGVAGERDPRKLVAVRHKRCHKSEAEFVAYLTGTWRDEHLLNLQAALRLYDTVRKSIADYERQLLEGLAALWRVTGVDLTRIDGIGTGPACTVLTEAGPDLSAFPDERHFASWLRLTPRRAAVSLQHSDSALGAAFRRTARRKGFTVAVFAIARKLAHLVYRALRFGQEYVDMGAERYEQRCHRQAVSNLKVHADYLGYDLIPHTPPVAA